MTTKGQTTAETRRQQIPFGDDNIKGKGNSKTRQTKNGGEGEKVLRGFRSLRAAS